MPLVRKEKHAYTGKVISVMDFPETQTISLLVVCKTRDGKAIADQTVSFNLSEDHPAAQGLYDGTVNEVGFLANGFSPEPVRGDEDRPIFALVGLVKSTVEALLGGNYTTGERANEEDAQRKSGMASRALEWIRVAVKKAVDEE